MVVVGFLLKSMTPVAPGSWLGVLYVPDNLNGNWALGVLCMRLWILFRPREDAAAVYFIRHSPVFSGFWLCTGPTCQRALCPYWASSEHSLRMTT